MSDEEASDGSEKVISIALGCLAIPLLVGLFYAPLSLAAVPICSVVAAVIVAKSRPLPRGKRIALGILLFFCFALVSGFLAYLGCSATDFRGVNIR